MDEGQATRRVSVELQPVGRRTMVPVGTTVLAAAQHAGVELVAICGGLGICETCRIRLAGGALGPVAGAEEEAFTDAELVSGLRLACQATVRGDVRVEILPESLSAVQRLQLEGRHAAPVLDPAVVPVEVTLPAPSLTDLRADAERLAAVLRAQTGTAVAIGLPVLVDLPARLRAQDWRACAAMHRSPSSSATGAEVVAVLPPSSLLYGLAVDVGTTKLAAYLLCLGTGETVAQVGAMNPQISYGEDVISRITYANTDPAAARTLHDRLLDVLNGLVDDLCAQSGVHRAQIVDAVVVGNTAMHHLFLGLPVRQLGEAPYVPAAGRHLELHAAEVGLRLAAGATLYLPPNIAGYVGADHVAMLLGGGLSEAAPEHTFLALDIGTNTEISLAHAGRLWSCSTASGPAFEGAHIHDGMRAVEGAVEHVRYYQGAFHVSTIADRAAIGICGSGILDAVAAGLEAGVIDERGALVKGHPLVTRGVAGPSYELVPASRSGRGRPVIVTRRDVNEIQLAKGAIRAGTEVLLAEAGTPAEAVDAVIVAGAFGTYLDLGSAVRTGLLLDLPRERFHQVGNAAGSGAQQLLLSRARRVRAERLAQEVQYIELTTYPAFTEIFLRALSF